MQAAFQPRGIAGPVDEPNVPPGFPWNLLREARVAFEVPRLLLRAASLAMQPQGSGNPVLVVPGFGTGDASTAPLRGYLRWLGHDVRGWGLGVNGGDVTLLVRLLLDRITVFARERQCPVALIGWSLGGLLAREAMRERPEIVARVITLGTPVVGGPKYTTVGEVYRRRGYDLDAIEAAARARDAVPLRRPVTAVFSRSDGVVAWQACIDRFNEVVEHVEVGGTHVGLGMNPDVYGIVAHRLVGSTAR
jgi:pimeloyl-ACP methyl ester carboxylesterase